MAQPGSRTKANKIPQIFPTLKQSLQRTQKMLLATVGAPTDGSISNSQSQPATELCGFAPVCIFLANLPARAAAPRRQSKGSGSTSPYAFFFFSAAPRGNLSPLLAELHQIHEVFCFGKPCWSWAATARLGQCSCFLPTPG